MFFANGRRWQIVIVMGNAVTAQPLSQRILRKTSTFTSDEKPVMTDNDANHDSILKDGKGRSENPVTH